MSKPVLETKSLWKTFVDGDETISAVKDVNLVIKSGQTNAIIGSSGSGKTTLLHLLAGLDTPSKGEVLLNGQPFSSIGHVQRGKLRNSHIGVVYQFHHLLHEFSALENVMLAARIGNRPVAEAKEKSTGLLDRVGMSHRLKHKPAELSGGERQRVAIARALVTEPSIVLADEPTGNLDSHTAESIEELILELNSEFNTAFLLVTHDLELASRMGRVYRMVDGELFEGGS